jgi:phosphoribosyl-AMP cyclohydrolase
VDIPAEVAARLAEGTLVAAIAQDAKNGEVLMMAWMNAEALALTLQTGKVTYWSRSRNQLWTKGESSGHTQQLISASYDCDGDALLRQVEQIGAACHTGERSCFYREIGSEQ